MTPVGELHVILDEVRQTRYGHVELARMAALGGADVIQYREKRPRSRELRMRTARAVVDAVGGLGAAVIVNDHVEVARSAGAAGVHLGPGDTDPAVARRMLGAAALIGVTANDLDRALRIADLPIDYIGVGPVFDTVSKANPAPVLGAEGLARIVAAVDRPVVAIGGITPERVLEVLATGAAGVAVLHAVACQPDPREAAGRFRDAIDRFRQGSGRRSHVRSDANQV